MHQHGRREQRHSYLEEVASPRRHRGRIRRNEDGVVHVQQRGDREDKHITLERPFSFAKAPECPEDHEAARYSEEDPERVNPVAAGRTQDVRKAR